MTIKLKPCPFCGGEAWTFHIPENDEYETKLHDWIWRTPGRWLVGCDTQLCMLNINNLPETFASEQEATEAWNKRAERSGRWIRKGGIYECSECGMWVPHRSPYCRDCGTKMDEGESE